jgi:hypothetical protein
VNDEAEQPVSTPDPTAVADAGRPRRPSSLRSAAASGQAGTGQAGTGQAASSEATSSEAVSGETTSSETAPLQSQRPKLTPPSFASKLTSRSFASELTSRSFASKLTPPQLPGKLTPPSFLRRNSKPAVRAQSTDPVAADTALPEESGPSPSQKLVTLVSERPEVGLGIAFAAGLVIASILKRLAR